MVSAIREWAAREDIKDLVEVNYLGKFLNSSSKNIAFFLKKETKISELAKIIGDKSISSTLNKLIKKSGS